MRIDQPVKALPSRLAKTRRQVAAVCYRIRKRGIEFLLVQTRAGRWIFPKGGVEPGLTPAQSAALEAFEEAGVHGRMEAGAFARYFRRKPVETEGMIADRDPSAINAYLCEVFLLEKPQESNRNPTWFTPEKSKQRLLKDRPAQFGVELASLIDLAVLRIRRLQGTHSNAFDRRQRDSLHEVHLEAAEPQHLLEAAVQAHLRRARQMSDPRRMHGQMQKPLLRLPAGPAAGTSSNLTSIDSRNRNRGIRRG